jgi:PAS domain S-box-containing protein
MAGTTSGATGPAPRRGGIGPAPPLDTLATAAAGPRQRGLAAGFCLLMALATLALLPHVAAPMPPMPGFLAINQGLLVLVYGLTSWLFYAQYRRTRSAAVLVLGAGSLYTTLMVLVQLVCFPAMLAPGLLLGQGPATLTWLWNFWHLGPPLFALPYAIMEGDGRARLTPPHRLRLATWGSIAGILAAAGLTAWAAIGLAHVLPVVVDPDGGYWALTTSGIGPLLFLLTAAALAVLCWTTRLRSVLQLWLAVSLFLLLLDNLVTDLGAARATMGWFVGRMQALLAGVVVLGVYLKEVDLLYRRAEQAAQAREDARAEAAAARENLEVALDASGMGDWEIDLATGNTRRTLRHDRLFGYAALEPDWSWPRFLDHVHEEDRARAAAAFARALQGEPLRLDCRIRRADDNTTRWLSLQGRTIFDAAGHATGIAGCVLDATERQQTEERLRQAERMEAVGQLTGGVAHDFNNLLTVIMGSLDLITRKPEDTARVEALARNALAATTRGADLTAKLLAFSRRQVVQPEVVNLNRLISELEPLLRRAVGETVEVVLDLHVSLDPGRLDQNQFQAALLNLAGNARDAMPAGGTLRIETRNVVLSATDLADLPELRPGRYLSIAIADTGTGMDAATAARAFEPFFTTKETGKGTGLGLSQVYGFARQAGGHCRIRTAPGRGCRIELLLPPSTEASAGAVVPEADTPLRQARHGEVVLVVEDEEAVRAIASESLQGLGYAVLSAPDARVALDILRGPSRVDILFSDVVMPGGMNGAQLADQARTIRPSLKVLLTSGYIVTATGGARDLPADVPLLRKPYRREDLATKLRAVMAG